MSLFLFRKLIPKDPPDRLELLRKFAQPQPEVDPKFLEFVEEEIPHIFPVGWDAGYSQRCLNSVLPTKACFESKRSEGGSRRFWQEDLSCEGEWREEFVEEVLASRIPRLNHRSTSRLVTVESSGKYRALSIPPFWVNRLRPLHETMYNQLSRQRWLLRGDAKPSRFKDFVAKQGEIFVSGDYESATDNLNSSTQKEILRCVLQTTRHVPSGIIVDAMRSMSLNLTVLDRKGNHLATRRQQSGQMMGNLLSFPLLCLINYLTFRYAVRDRTVPLRVNGDDIVFRATSSQADKWAERVGVSGLTLSKGKTLRDSRFFSLNSTLFRSATSRPRVVPLIRSRTLFGAGDDDAVESLPGRFRSFSIGYSGWRRDVLHADFLRENSGWINRSCRSLTRGLGCKVTVASLIKSGLWARELRYLALDKEDPLPPIRSEWAHAPSGFRLKLVSPRIKRSLDRDVELQNALVESAWKRQGDGDQPVYGARVTGLDLSDSKMRKSSRWFSRIARVSNMPFRFVKASFQKLDRSVWGRSVGCGLVSAWVPEHYAPAIRFVSGSSTFTVEKDKFAGCAVREDYKDKRKGVEIFSKPVPSTTSLTALARGVALVGGQPPTAARSEQHSCIKEMGCDGADQGELILTFGRTDFGPTGSQASKCGKEKTVWRPPYVSLGTVGPRRIFCRKCGAAGHTAPCRVKT